jgi:type VI secretion system protein ImpK
MSLVDCYSELFAFTGYLLRDVDRKPVRYEAAEKNYSLLIARSEERARSSGYSEREWLDGFFPVCAWIDESILCSNWSDSAKWAHEQLQRRYFQTTNAGEEVFARLAALGEEDREVREVYAYCLAIGFKGAYYQAAEKELQEIAVQNIRAVSEESALDFPQELFPDAYEAALAGRRERRKRWRTPSLFSITVFLLPIVAFWGLFFSYDVMLSNEVAGYLGLDVAPLYRSPVFKDRIAREREHQVTTPSEHKKSIGEAVIAAGEKLIHRAEHHPGPGHYRVKPGDTLSSIAGHPEVYGDSLMWTVLYRQNLKELSGLKEGADLPVVSLPPGIRLLIATPHEIQERKKSRSGDRWIVHVFSTTVHERAVRAAIRLVGEGHTAFLSRTKSKGREWTTVRVGFFKTRAEADERVKTIKGILDAPTIRSEELSHGEFERYAGY